MNGPFFLFFFYFLTSSQHWSTPSCLIPQIRAWAAPWTPTVPHNTSGLCSTAWRLALHLLSPKWTSGQRADQLGLPPVGMWTRAGGQRIIRGWWGWGGGGQGEEDSGGSCLFSSIARGSTMCPPLCWLGGPCSLTASGKIEYDTGQEESWYWSGRESRCGETGRIFSEGEE